MATAQTPFGFPPKGSLRRVPFPRLIREVARHNIDGSLYLLSGQTKKVVFFTRGQPVFVRSNVLSECLGQILAQEGLITQEQCEQTLEAIRRTGKKQGELLVEMGILSEGNLRYGLEAQLRAKLFDIFSWEEGRYQFKPDGPSLQFGLTLKASAEGVIVEAIQDQYTEDRATEALEAVRGKYPTLLQDATDAANLALLPEERYFLQCLDGSRNVRELLDTNPEPPVPTPRSLLCGLMAAGLVRLLDEALERTPWPEPPALTPTGGSDEELTPRFEPQALITEYEDTPLPGEMPRSPVLLGDHEDGFEEVVEDSDLARVSSVVRSGDISQDLIAAEPDSIEETFDDDQIELTDESDSGDALLPPLIDPDLAASAPPDGPSEQEPSGPAVPSVVALTDTMPTPPGDQPSDAIEASDSTPSGDAIPTPIPARGRHARATPPPVLPVSSSSEPKPTPRENDLLDLSPDDDLLMADANSDPLAMKLLDAPSTDQPSTDGQTIVSSSGATPDELDPLHEDSVVEVSPDELVLQDEDEDVGSDGTPPTTIDSADADLVDFADLDDIDLVGDPTGESSPDDAELGDDMLGALRFNEGQSAVSEQRWTEAVELLEQAYQNGFDVAELHAMLAYSRFQASGLDEQTASHAFELLDYAQQMNPSLDLVHAYRGAIHRAQGDIPQARDALERALELNPYCELAMELMDSIS